MALIRLENADHEAVFDARNGALVSFVHKPSGWTMQGRAELARTFEMVVPLPERLLNRVDGRKQACAEVMQDGQRIIFRWEKLTSEYGGALEIEVRCTVELSEAGLHFEAEIANHSPYPVESFAYPYIGDLRRKGERLTRAHMHYDNLNFRSLYPEFDNERGYWGTEFPIQMVPAPESPFVLVLAEDAGLYAGCHDVSAKERVEFQFRLKPGYGKVGRVPAEDSIGGKPVCTEFMATHFPFVQPNETYRLSPIVLTGFAGGWHAGIDVYKAWRETWYEPPQSPAWLHEIHAWQQLQMSSWGDSLTYRYADLAQIARDCQRHGVTALQLTGWTLYGQDGRLPIHAHDPRMGTAEELQAGIESLQDAGVKVILYEKYTCADVGTEWYQSELHQYASKDIFGNTHGHEGWQYDTPAHLAGINTRPYAWMCMNSSEWRRVVLEEIEKSLAYKPDGILLDESMWHGKNAFYCYDERHGHRVPAHNFAGDAEFERELVELLRKKNPDLVLAGEGPYDLQNRAYGLTYHRTHGNHVAVMRYIDPKLPMLNWAYGYDDRENINTSLLYRYLISYEPRHFRGRLDEFPLTLEYGKLVDGLRRRYRSFLWDGEFRDTLGATVTVGGVAHRPYSVFREAGTGKLAVVIANQAEGEITAEVEIEGGYQSAFVTTPEAPAMQPYTNGVKIGARSVVVVFCTTNGEG